MCLLLSVSLKKSEEDPSGGRGEGDRKWALLLFFSTLSTNSFFYRPPPNSALAAAPRGGRDERGAVVKIFHSLPDSRPEGGWGATRKIVCVPPVPSVYGGGGTRITLAIEECSGFSWRVGRGQGRGYFY